LRRAAFIGLLSVEFYFTITILCETPD